MHRAGERDARCRVQDCLRDDHRGLNGLVPTDPKDQWRFPTSVTLTARYARDLVTALVTVAIRFAINESAPSHESGRWRRRETSQRRCPCSFVTMHGNTTKPQRSVKESVPCIDA